MRQYQAKKQLEELRARQRAEQQNKKTTGDKIAGGAQDAYKVAGGVNKAVNMYKNMKTPQMPSADFASKVGATEGLKNVGQGLNATKDVANMGNYSLNTANTASNLANTGDLASKIGAGSAGAMTNTASTLGNTASTASNTASTVGNAGGAMSGALQGASKAMPVVGTVAGLASAGNNFAKGNHVDGAMDLAKTGAMFIPGIGWAVAGAIQIAQMVKGMIDKKKQKANAKAEQASQKAMQENMQEYAEKKGELEQIKANNAQAMQDQLQKNNADTAMATGSDVIDPVGINTPMTPQTPLNGANAGAENNDPGTFKENVPFGKELNQLEEKSPVDLSALGQTTSGSMFNAVDNWLGTDLEGTLGNTTPGAITLDASPINRRDSQGQIVNNPQEQGVLTGMAMPVNYTQENMPEVPQVPQAPGVQGKGGMILDGAKNIMDILQNKLGSVPDNISSGLNQFAEGYKDNTQTSFSQGDLARRMQQQEQAPVKNEDGSYSMQADEVKKSLMNRLGELAGTGQRILSHPLTHAGVAGLVSKMAGGDIDDIAKAMFEYGGKKAEADRYYQQTTGKTDRPILNTYGADDYKTKIQKDEMDRKQGNWQTEYDWKRAKEQREYELAKEIHNAKLKSGWYTKPYGRYGYGGKSSQDQELLKALKAGQVIMMTDQSGSVVPVGVNNIEEAEKLGYSRV